MAEKAREWIISVLREKLEEEVRRGLKSLNGGINAEETVGLIREDGEGGDPSPRRRI